MKKNILWIILPLFIYSVSGFSQRPWPESQGGVQVFYDQMSTSITDAQCQFMATHACGTQKEPLSFIDRVRAYNPNFLLLHYELSFGAGDLLDLEGENWVSDWDSVNPHENWFLHDALGHRCLQTDWNWYFMDPSGAIEGAVPGWKEYWVDRAERRMDLNDCDGIFSDSHGFPWNMDYYPDGFTPPDDGGLGVNLTIFDQYVMSQFHNGTNNYMYIPNLGQLITGWDTTDNSNCDGAMIEIFSTYDCATNIEPEDWQLEVDRVLQLANQDKILIFQNDVDYWSPECRMWLVANYFMMKNERSYINLIFPDWCNDGMDPNWLAEYELKLGNFSGAIPASSNDMFNATWGVYVRNYDRGMVLVNPTWSAQAVSFGSSYYRVSCSGGGCVDATGVFGDNVAITFSPTTGFSMPAMSASIVTYTNDPMSAITETTQITSENIVIYNNENILNISVSDKPYNGILSLLDLSGRSVFEGICTNGSCVLPEISDGFYLASLPDHGIHKLVLR
jgi:hypothetical protein